MGSCFGPIFGGCHQGPITSTGSASFNPARWDWESGPARLFFKLNHIFYRFGRLMAANNSESIPGMFSIKCELICFIILIKLLFYSLLIIDLFFLSINTIDFIK